MPPHRRGSENSGNRRGGAGSPRISQLAKPDSQRITAPCIRGFMGQSRGQHVGLRTLPKSWRDHSATTPQPFGADGSTKAPGGNQRPRPADQRATQEGGDHRGEHAELRGSHSSLRFVSCSTQLTRKTTTSAPEETGATNRLQAAARRRTAPPTTAPSRCRRSTRSHQRTPQRSPARRSRAPSGCLLSSRQLGSELRQKLRRHVCHRTDQCGHRRFRRIPDEPGDDAAQHGPLGFSSFDQRRVDVGSANTATSHQSLLYQPIKNFRHSRVQDAAGHTHTIVELANSRLLRGRCPELELAAGHRQICSCHGHVKSESRANTTTLVVIQHPRLVPVVAH